MRMDRLGFLNFSSGFLIGLLCLSLVLAAIAGINPLNHVHVSLSGLAIGVAAAVVMVLMFGFIGSVRDQAEELMGKALANCLWYDLLILAILIGIIEELLFRGVLEPWLARLHPAFAFIAVNIVFGLLHAVSRTYAVVAALLGGILSLLAHWPGEFNLFRPMVAHAVYDYIGFIWLASRYRRSIHSPEMD